MKEIVKWLQGIGVGVAYSIADAVLALTPAASMGTVEWLVQTAVLAVLTRLAGLGVSKLPARTTP